MIEDKSLPAASISAIIELYKRDVDRSLIRENLLKQKIFFPFLYTARS